MIKIVKNAINSPAKFVEIGNKKMTPGITPAPFFKKKFFKSLLAKKLTGGSECLSYRRYHGSHAAMALFDKSGP